MNKQSASSILASFATLKSLCDAKAYRSAYQILSEFINYIIGTQNIHAFTPVEMKRDLRLVFGFEIPEAVVKTASNHLPFLIKKNGGYIVDKTQYSFNSDFISAKESAEASNSSIIDALSSFVKAKNPTQEIREDVLTQEFIAFLIDDHHKTTNLYTDVISEFILKHEGEADIQEKLRDIREGSILYIGLNHNINETGSITKSLTLYLDTEVLFGLYGLNGEIHKKLAEDLFALIRNANADDSKIKLRYFSEVKKEIDAFFNSAEDIVNGKISMFDTTAMRAIVNHCATPGDVLVKKADFFHTLKISYGIIQDEHSDYYSEENDEYNLESISHTEPHIQDSWRFISHINKRRKGLISANNLDAGHLLVTNTKSTINASKEQVEHDKEKTGKDHVCDYAVSIDRMTNILWYKLGNGFGKCSFPSNASMVLKARTVLAASISRNISEVYNEAKEQFRKGEISQDQLAARIITLRKKPILPEELASDSIDDVMDFSPEYLSRYEEEVKSKDTALLEKNQEIERIEKQKERQIKEKDDVIAQKDQVI